MNEMRLALLPFRHVFRRFLRSPSFTLLTLITLAVGIGANTAIFSILNGVLLKPLPYPDADRLVGVWETAVGLNIKELNASPATYFTFREEATAFEDSGVWRGDSVTLTGAGEPEQIAGIAVTDGILRLLGVQPLLGRWFP